MGPLPRARCVLVVDEFHVAAERDPGQPPARSFPVVETDNLGSETNRKCFDRNTAPSGHEKMAELVEKYDNGQYEEEADHRKKRCVTGTCEAE